MSGEWLEKVRPSRLERRYEFTSYEQLRTFLDKAAELSEATDIYPDMGFGRDYVNMTIHVNEGSDTIDAEQRQFADDLDKLIQTIIDD